MYEVFSERNLECTVYTTTRCHLVLHFPGKYITLKSDKPECRFRGISIAKTQRIRMDFTYIILNLIKLQRCAL